MGTFACDVCVFSAHLWQQREDVNSDSGSLNNARLGDTAANVLV